MYDYISIRKDKEHSQHVLVERIVEISESISDLKRIGNVSFSANIGKFQININGISADSKGNYSYTNDSDFVAINLIEIDIPQGAEGIHEQEILSVAKQFAIPLKWEIVDHETGMLIFKPEKA